MEKKKLRRRCTGSCGRILDVDNLDDWDGRDEGRWTNTVRWQSDPYMSEIWDDHELMWLCGRCYDERRDDI